MLAVDPRVVDAAWSKVEPLLPQHLPPDHPLGTHRTRIPDRECFVGLLFRLVTGCSWFVASQICGAGETTLRRRRDEWVRASVFERLVEIVMAEYDSEIGIEIDDVAIDGSLHKAPFGGEGSGKSPVDRGKLGWKWSIATEMQGIPIGWVAAAANQNDSTLLVPTLIDVVERGHFSDMDTLHLDRGYDSKIARKNLDEIGVLETVIATKPEASGSKEKKAIEFGKRWLVERTHSWLSNFGQMRRNTDRFTRHRHAQLSFAIAMIMFVKLFKNR
jgi:transposase